MGINNVSVSENSTKVKEKGSIRAYTGGCIASMVSMPIGGLAINNMSKIGTGLTADELSIINKGIDSTLQSTGLADKGVQIVNMLEEKGVKIPSAWKDFITCQVNPAYAIQTGKNACFSPAQNSVILNREKLAPSAFHEMGHAFNYNSSKFWKAMQNMRMPAMAAASLFTIFAAVTKNAEAKEGEELTTGQKVKNFVRNHAGILASASMLPVVAEEIMASVRGCQWAKENLPQELAKKVKVTNMWGALSYIAAAAGVGIGAHAALKIKDSIMENQKMKAQQQEVIQEQPTIQENEKAA